MLSKDFLYGRGHTGPQVKIVSPPLFTETIVIKITRGPVFLYVRTPGRVGQVPGARPRLCLVAKLSVLVLVGLTFKI